MGQTGRIEVHTKNKDDEGNKIVHIGSTHEMEDPKRISDTVGKVMDIATDHYLVLEVGDDNPTSFIIIPATEIAFVKILRVNDEPPTNGD